MSAITPAPVFELHFARSNLIDAYNEADLAARNRLKKQVGSEKPLIGQNLDALAKISAGPQYSKADKKRVDELVDELRSFQSLRCDVVHSRMQSIHVDGLSHALFANVQEAVTVGRRGLFMSKLEMETCTNRLLAIAKGISRVTDAQPQHENYQNQN